MNDPSGKNSPQSSTNRGSENPKGIELKDLVSNPLPPGMESRPGLLRVLGLGMAISMVIGNVIGSGIFLKPGAIAAHAGDFRMILAAWGLGGGLCILGGLCFAELAAMLPEAGGLYAYFREAYGRPVAFLFGWTEFLFGRPASIGALSVAFVYMFGEAMGTKFPPLIGVLLAVGLIAAMAGVNILGVIWGGRVQATTTLVKCLFLAGIVLLPLFFLFGEGPGFEWANYATRRDTTGTFAARFAAVMLAVMWAYNGWHGVAPVAEEVKNPQRNIPLALLGGIGVIIVLYLGANIAYHGVLTMDELAEGQQSAAQLMIAKLVGSYGPETVRTAVAIMSGVIMCSIFGAINANIMEGPRVSFAMGRDGVFFRSLGTVHAIYRTPAVATVVQAMMSAFLVIISAILVAYREEFSKRSIFEMLTDYVIFSASIFYTLAVMAVLVLRRRRPEWPRPFRTPAYPVVPLAFIAFYAWFLSYVYLSNPLEANLALAQIFVGIPVYVAWRIYASRATLPNQAE